MRNSIFIAFVLFSACYAFDVDQFLERNCEESGSDIKCSVYFYNSDLFAFAHETFTISNAENVYLMGAIGSINEYLFEKFPKANRFYIDSNEAGLNKPFERPYNEKIISKITELVLDVKKLHTYYKSTSFNSLKSLKTLEINGGNFDIDEDLLVKNTKLETVIIRNAGLDTITPKAFGNLKKLSNIDLSGNNLRTLDSKLFSSQSKLTCVDLSRNSIEFVPMAKFWPSSLVNLDLSSNQISTITKNHFKNLKNLASLDLSYNRIDVLSRDAFATNTKLIFASIRSNKVNKVLDILLPNQKKLVHFDVSSNRLQELKNFVGAPGIQYLNASHNQLTTFNENTYNTSSVTLDFSFNQITSITFPKVDSLKIVYLNNNRIPPIQITRQKFSGVPNLQELYLQGNGMTWIYDDAFDGLEKLEIIDY